MALLLLGGPLVLEADERVTLPFIFDTPSGGYASLATSQAIDRLATLLLRHTDFAPREIPAKTVEGCRGSISCMGLRVRAQIQDAQASHLAVVSNLAAPDQPDRVSVLLIDLTRAVECSDLHVDEVERERCASDRALVASDLGHQVADADGMLRHFADVVTRIFRPAFEATGHWEPFGQIELTSERSNTVVSLDGRPLGNVAAGRALITGVRPGARTLRLQELSAGDEDVEIQVEVTRGGTAELTLETSLVHPGREAALWSGIVLAAAGAAFTAWGIAGEVPNIYCLEEPCEPAGTFKSVGDLVSTRSGEPHRRDVLAVPLGYSLLITGSALSLGALFEGEKRDVPWISILAGVAAGGLAYGISAAVD